MDKTFGKTKKQTAHKAPGKTGASAPVRKTESRNNALDKRQSGNMASESGKRENRISLNANHGSYKSSADVKQENRISSNKLREKTQQPKTDPGKALSGEPVCPYFKKCGGCHYRDVTYQEQLEIKQKQVRQLLGKFGQVSPIIGMEHPYYYRNKVHAVLDRDKKGNIISGIYEEKTHRVVPIEKCLIEDEKSQAIIRTVRDMLKSFKIKVYDEDTGYGLVRHVLVRRGFTTGEIMVVLVAVSPVFPSKNNFVKALRQIHPEITTVVLNVNDRNTSMVLGSRDIVLYGKGYIHDKLCGRTFRISPGSFYQVNPVQTEVLYRKAIGFANLTGKERVIDAYCGIGTIGLAAAGHAGEVIGVELNKDAVRDAKINARENEITNARFFQGDAGEFMTSLAEEGGKADVVFLDPPRSGSSEEFLTALTRLAPQTVVYISCNPETLARDLTFLTSRRYQVQKIQPVDMFCFANHCEVICLLSNRN